MGGRGFATAAVLILFVLAFIAITRRLGKSDMRSRRGLTAVVMGVVILAAIAAFIFGR